MLAVGASEVISSDTQTHLIENWKNFLTKNSGWKFGHVCYDFKNQLENLSSQNPDQIKFPDLFFFIPKIVIQLLEKELRIETDSGHNLSLIHI